MTTLRASRALAPARLASRLVGLSLLVVACSVAGCGDDETVTGSGGAGGAGGTTTSGSGSTTASGDAGAAAAGHLSLIHISEPPSPLYISYAVFCLKKKIPSSRE